MATPMLCEEPQASHSTLPQATQEAGRQRFRSGAVPPGANPQEILSCISEAARQWLCPQEHDKDQIVDMVILEQFLAVLPVALQAWVKAQEPSSSTEAVQLAETYVSEQEPSGASQELQKDSITFEDVSIRFLEEEWALLNLEEKTLYWSVMQQNYDNVAWLSVEMGSKGEEDSQQETPEPMAELLEISNKEISWGFKENSFKENPLERQPESSSEEKDVSDLKETTRDAELDLETRCVYSGCGKEDEPSSLVGSRKSHREEDPEPAILSGELQESSERKIPQDPAENLMKEDQKELERQQSNNPRMEENFIPFREDLRDHRDSRPGRETPCIAVDGEDQGESITLPHEQNIYTEDDFECVALPEETLFISVEDISQGAEKNSQLKPINIYSLNDLNSTYSQIGVNGTAALNSQKTIILDSEQISIPGKEGGEEESVLSGNGLLELTTGILLFDAQPTPDPQLTGPEPEKSSEYHNIQKNGQGENLPEGSSLKKLFIPSSASTTQTNCSDSGENSDSVSVLIKHRKSDRKRKCSRRNMSAGSVLRKHQRLHPGGKLQKHLNLKNWWASRKLRGRLPKLQTGLGALWKHGSININTQSHETLQMETETHIETSEAASSTDSREAKPGQRAPSPLLPDKTAAELMEMVKQLLTDMEQIKSELFWMHPMMASIQNTLGNLFGCTDDAEHRISDLEFTSRNTKAQMLQHYNDIRAIGAKVVRKGVQANVIAGLWPSLEVKRKMSP
ncbi:zinc finger protein 436-like [Sphaerodactylus townsendi]|uniref:zinc finger protein 436-like n=1 Tax=Sphaerodactylus townsendi TaxID=933632 RepID=UPI002026037A|nr:zinc finger protein 436-like [Sphaerodactylus townsendi]